MYAHGMMTSKDFEILGESLVEHELELRSERKAGRHEFRRASHHHAKKQNARTLYKVAPGVIDAADAFEEGGHPHSLSAEAARRAAAPSPAPAAGAHN